MASGGPRRGRRDNGLTATAYAVVADVDPRVGEHLLDLLGGEGIAAYLQPAADLHPVTRANLLPSTPADRLFVDQDHVATARAQLARLLEPSGSGQTGGQGGASGQTGGQAGASGQGGAGAEGAAALPGDFDALWASIVAGFDAEPAPGTATWPDAEDVTGGRRRTGQPTGADPTDPRRGALDGAMGTATGPGDLTRPATGGRDDGAPDPETTADGDRDGAGDDAARGGPVQFRFRDGDGYQPPSLLSALDTFGTGLPDPEEEDFRPPPPPPVPRPSAYTVLAVLAALAGLGILVFPDALPISPDTALFLGAAGLVTGFVMLILRLRPGDDEQDEGGRDPDDGAVV